ncbi:MAG: hydantoinase B/oxoprolinase family protein [Clostridia bacterium]|nr:hydantoinase B/oxoprolinase family protein [Clostridia bacterium]
MTTGFDPVTLEVLWRRLIQIADECWLTIWRTAFSTIMGDAKDFGCEILDPAGHSLAHAERSMPVFNLSLPLAVRAMLERFPPSRLAPGDVLVTNDPWLCAGHLFDIAVVTPVFRGGRLVALVGSVGHTSDIGGTKDSLAAREVYEEGLQIPPLKLMRRGRPDETLFALLRANVRKHEMVEGDVHALVSANAVGARRLLALMDEYGLEDLEPLGAVIQARSEEAMRRAIGKVPDGQYTFAVESDGLGRDRLRLPVCVTVSGETVTVDFTGAPPEAERGGINCTYNYTASHTVYALKCILTPEVPSNAGCYRPIRVVAPEGSILNCRHPASVNLRTKTGWYIASAVFGALAPVLPDRVKAHTAQPIGVPVYGREASGETFNDNLLFSGGAGAWRGGDGQSTMLFPTSAANVSVEMFESRAPVVVVRKELRVDSGGPGTWRGGLGQVVELRKLRDDGRPVLFGPHAEGMVTSVPGLLGGRSGARARVRVTRPGRPEEGLPDDGTVVLRSPDESLVIELAGGSGYGEPFERDPQAVARDVRLGYVSREAAENEYGVAIGPDGAVDEARTAALRQGRAARV